MKTGIFWIIFFIGILLPFEEFIFKLAHNDIAIIIIRILNEIPIYLALIMVILYNMSHGKFSEKTPIDLPLLILTIILFLSVFLNKSSLVSSLMNYRTTIRFMALFYLIVNIGFNQQYSKKFMKALIVIGIIESLLCIVQFILGNNFINFFRPPETEISLGPASLKLFTGTLKIGAAIGTLGSEIGMGCFLLVIITILASQYMLAKSKKWWRRELLIILLFIVSAFLTYKRGTFLLSLAIIPAILFLLNKWKQLVTYCLAGSIALASFLIIMHTGSQIVSAKKVEISPLDSLKQLFSEEYVDRASQASRGFLIKDVGGEIISSIRLIGYSPDEEYAKTELAKKGGGFSKLIFFKGFEDVFWVALLVYYGHIGLLIFIWLLYRLYKTSKKLIQSPDDYRRFIGITMCTLILIAIPLNFIYRAFEIKFFSYYFWFIAGLAVIESKREHQEKLIKV